MERKYLYLLFFIAFLVIIILVFSGIFSGTLSGIFSGTLSGALFGWDRTGTTSIVVPDQELPELGHYPPLDKPENSGNDNNVPPLDRSDIPSDIPEGDNFIIVGVLTMILTVYLVTQRRAQ